MADEGRSSDDDSHCLSLKCTAEGSEAKYLKEYRRNRRCCPLCNCEASISTNHSLIQFYLYPEGLQQHVRLAHPSAQFTKDLLTESEKRSKNIVAHETYSNLMILSSKREDEHNRTGNFKKCFLKCPNGTDGTECNIFAKTEKEAAKLFALYLHHKGEIYQIQEREKGTVISVKSPDLEINFMVWKAETKFYLEACWSRMVSIYFFILLLTLRLFLPSLIFSQNKTSKILV